MGETTEPENNEASAEVEIHKKEVKHEEAEGKEKMKDEKVKDKKKKKNKDGEEDGGKEEKKKNPEEKRDAGKLKLKLENIDAKIQALVTKKEEILKLLKEVEQNGGNSNVEIKTASPHEDSLVK